MVLGKGHDMTLVHRHCSLSRSLLGRFTEDLRIGFPHPGNNIFHPGESRVRTAFSAADALHRLHDHCRRARPMLIDIHTELHPLGFRQTVLALVRRPRTSTSGETRRFPATRLPTHSYSP